MTVGDGNGCANIFLAIPALLMRRSIYPWRALTVSTSERRESRLVTSHSTGINLLCV